jgi:hypothetical protein
MSVCPLRLGQAYAMRRVRCAPKVTRSLRNQSAAVVQAAAPLEFQEHACLHRYVTICEIT